MGRVGACGVSVVVWGCVGACVSLCEGWLSESAPANIHIGPRRIIRISRSIHTAISIHIRKTQAPAGSGQKIFTGRTGSGRGGGGGSGMGSMEAG